MRGLLALLALLTLAGLSLWWLLSLQTEQQINPTASTSPKLILNQVQATRFNHQGEREYSLSAPRLQQWGEENEGHDMHIEQPEMILYQDQQPLWHLNAHSARILQDDKIVELHNGVEGIRHRDDPQNRLQVNSEDLTIDLRANTLATEREVLLSTPHGEMRGTGLRGQLDQQIYTLSATVRGQYAAP